MWGQGILQDSNFLTCAQEIINSAQRNIYISTFKIEKGDKSKHRYLNGLLDTLIRKKASGVDVRLLTNKQGEQGHVPHTNAKAINYLKKGGVKVKWLRNSRICHAKMILVDDYYCIIGSHNLSLKSCHGNYETSILITNCIMIERLIRDFLFTWSGN